MDLRINNALNFGWSKQTHVQMTLKALEKNKLLSSAEKQMLANFSKLPDELESEKGYFNNTHFYFPDSENKSFGKESDSNNALSQFIKHYRKAFNATTKKDFLYETAFALHFLQDVSTPLHTEKGSFWEKLRDYYLHKNFERGEKHGADSKLQLLAQNYKRQNIKFLKLDDLFINTSKFSAQDKYKVSRFNKSEWFNIQQECFNYGVNASREFVDFMLKFLPKIK